MISNDLMIIEEEAKEEILAKMYQMEWLVCNEEQMISMLTIHVVFVILDNFN